MSHAHNREGEIRRVAIVFSGGPAPAANAVIAAAASAFKRAGGEVLGLLQGYQHLLDREASDGLATGAVAKETPPQRPSKSRRSSVSPYDRDSRLPVPHRVITDA